MELVGSRTIGRSREMVWEAVLDPDVLKKCIPGCSEVNGSASDGYEAVVTQKIGPVKATFRGSLELSDVVPQERCVINGQGKGGAAGFARGVATITLADSAEGTEVGYSVTVKVGGKIAQIGSRLITGVARHLANQFFDHFEQHFVDDTVVPEDSADTQSEQPLATAEHPPAALPEQAEGTPPNGAATQSEGGRGDGPSTVSTPEVRDVPEAEPGVEAGIIDEAMNGVRPRTDDGAPLLGDAVGDPGRAQSPADGNTDAEGGASPRQGTAG